MLRYKILHRTEYRFSAPVTLLPHSLRLRPREGAELRIESSSLIITPPSILRWYRDVEDNAVAIATFADAADCLTIESEVLIQHYNEFPLDFLVADYAAEYPFRYTPEDQVVLMPYIALSGTTNVRALANWVSGIWRPGERIQTYALLERLCVHINRRFTYQIREEPGVQPADVTLTRGSGSCRDFASLLVEAARFLGLAARFVSGYLNALQPPGLAGSTHAWAEVYLPGAGWKGFDPTTGHVAGADHVAVAVARQPWAVPPVEGAFKGPPGAVLQVGVWVTPIEG